MMTDQVDKLLGEMNFEARKRLLCNEQVTEHSYDIPVMPPDAKAFADYILSQMARDIARECMQNAINNLFKAEWPWPVCQAAFPHDIFAATELYRRIHGEDPPYLRGTP